MQERGSSLGVSRALWPQAAGSRSGGPGPARRGSEQPPRREPVPAERGPSSELGRDVNAFDFPVVRSSQQGGCCGWSIIDDGHPHCRDVLSPGWQRPRVALFDKCSVTGPQLGVHLPAQIFCPPVVPAGLHPDGGRSVSERSGYPGALLLSGRYMSHAGALRRGSERTAHCVVEQPL